MTTEKVNNNNNLTSRTMSPGLTLFDACFVAESHQKHTCRPGWLGSVTHVLRRLWSQIVQVVL